MTGIAPAPDDLRAEAARMAFALIRFEEVIAHPRQDVESFLVGLSSPALLSPTTTRGTVALTLLNELSGERRRWAEKTLTNLTAGFDEVTAKLGLSATSRFLLAFDEESHVFSFAAVRLWTQEYAVQVGWNIQSLRNDPRADARFTVMRSDGTWS